MSEFKVSAYIFDERITKGGAMVGRLTLLTRDHDLATQVAGTFAVESEHYRANVDVEMRVPMGRRAVWVDCNPHALERAAEALMQAAQDVRDASRSGVKVRPAA